MFYMKRIYHYILSAMFVLPAFSGCDDAVNKPLDNALYLVDAMSRDEYDCLMRPMRDADYNVTVRMTHKLSHDVTVTLAVDREFPQEHFEKFGEELVILPDENWALYNEDGTVSDNGRVTVTIPANSVSAVVPVKISSYSGELSQYALPLAIESVSEDIHVLENLSTQCYVFQAPFTVPVLFINDESSVYKDFADLAETRNWTVEFHYAIEVGVADSRWGVPLVFSGLENDGEGFYVRQYRNGGMDIHLLGTFGVGSYELSDFGHGSWYTDTAYQGYWHHFALVCENGTVTSYLDGTAMNSMSSPEFNTAYKFVSMMLCDGHQYGDIGFSEVRLWSVARTVPQLTRFKYDVSPDAPGLLAYYKLNEGEGSTVLKDSSPNGNDIDISATVEYVDSETGTTKTRYDVYWGTARSDDDFVSLRTVE